MLIAIDHGNYAIKTPNHSFVSGLSEHTVKPPMADEILEYDGRYWTTSGKRLSYMRDKTQDERYFILTLFAIAKELEDTGRYSPVEQIQLAVGLPPEHYGVLKDKFARYFKRDGIIKFVYKDKPYSIIENGNAPQRWIQEFLDHRNIQSLTRIVAVECIDHIMIYEGKRIEVTFAHMQAYEALVSRMKDYYINQREVG